jgi:hypothetical protein
MKTPSPAWLAWSIGLFTTASSVAAVGLLARNTATLEQLLATYSIGGAVTGASFGLMGALIAARRPTNAVGWLFLVIGLSQGFDAFDTEYALYTLSTQPGALPGATIMNWLRWWTWAPGLGLLPLSLLLFPTGQLPSTRWRWAPWAVGAAIALLVIPVAVAVWPARGEPLEREALPSQGNGQFALALQLVGLALTGSNMVAAAVAMLLRFRQAQGVERQQIKWLAFAGTLTAILLVLVFLNEFLQFQGVGVVVNVVYLAVVAPSIPIAAGIAILRYRLYDIDIIIRRTLIYSLLSVALAMLYFGSVVIFQQLLHPLVGPGETPLVTVASTLAIAALFTPLRRRLQAGIDHRFYRRKYNAEQVLATFSETMRNETDLDRLTARLIAVVEETMQPTQVSLWLHRPAATIQRREARIQEITS